MLSLKSSQVGRIEDRLQQAAHLGDLTLFDAPDDQMHHRRLEQQAALDDLGERRHVFVVAGLGLVHALEHVVRILGQEGAAADAPAHEALPLHHRERAAHRGPAGVQLLRQLALVGQLGARHHQPVLDAAQQRPVDQRRRRPIVGADGGQLRQCGGRGHQ